jgi:hypothetical protein
MVEFGSAVPLSVTVELFVSVAFAGLVIAGAAGACVSTVKLRVAALGSGLPASSVAITENV